MSSWPALDPLASRTGQRPVGRQKTEGIAAWKLSDRNLGSVQTQRPEKAIGCVGRRRSRSRSRSRSRIRRRRRVGLWGSACVGGWKKKTQATALSTAALGLRTVVVERRSAPDEFETAKAYLYLIDKRGQKWTDAHGLTDAIRAAGVSNAEYSLTRAFPDARGCVNIKPLLLTPSMSTSIWIPRATLLATLSKACQANPLIELRYGCSICDEIAAPDDRGRVLVETRDAKDRRVLYAPMTLVGKTHARGVPRDDAPRCFLRKG